MPSASASELPSLPAMAGWTQLGKIPGGASALVESDLGWYAVGWAHSSILWTSADGETWTEVTDTGLTYSVYQIWDATPGLIVGGNTADVDFGAPLMWTSTNGTSWTQSPIVEPPRNGVVKGLLQWRGHLLASGGLGPAESPDEEQAAVWRSVDGTNWTEVRIGGSFALQPVEFGDALVLVGAAGGLRVTGPPLAPLRGALWTSADGITWTEQPESPALAQASFTDVTVLNGRVVVVGSVWDDDTSTGRPTIWTYDASGWAIAHQGPCCGAFARVAESTSGLLAVLSRDRDPRSVLYGSVDGTSWELRGTVAGLDGSIDGFAQTRSHGLVVIAYDQTLGQTRLLLPPG